METLTRDLPSDRIGVTEPDLGRNRIPVFEEVKPDVWAFVTYREPRPLTKRERKHWRLIEYTS